MLCALLTVLQILQAAFFEHVQLMQRCLEQHQLPSMLAY
jgi:hypothetical protein